MKLLGQSLKARDFERQVAESQIRIDVLSRYKALGIPITEPNGIDPHALEQRLRHNPRLQIIRPTTLATKTMINLCSAFHSETPFKILKGQNRRLCFKP
jgi:hypothetical protein